MIYAIEGTIEEILDNEIVIKTKMGLSYILFVSRPKDFIVNEERNVPCYEVYGENDHYLAGFPSKLERAAFLSLIKVKGIGPKTALSALRETTPDLLFKAIQANNTAYLKKLPGIGAKAASQIILDLKGRLASSPSEKKGNPELYDEVRSALKELGFKVKAIDEALASIVEPNLKNEEVLRLALKKLRTKAK